MENVENFCGKIVENSSLVKIVEKSVENVERFSPKIVENFIIVENHVEIVEKFSTGFVENFVDCGKLCPIFHTLCGKNCGKVYLVVENLWKTFYIKNPQMPKMHRCEYCSILNIVQS